MILAAREGIVDSVDDSNTEYYDGNLHNEGKKLNGETNMIIIRHEDFLSIYSHVKPHSSFVNAGQKVSQGDPIGLVGKSGWHRVPNLHFQIYGKQKGEKKGTSKPFYFSDYPKSLWHRDISLETREKLLSQFPPSENYESILGKEYQKAYPKMPLDTIAFEVQESLKISSCTNESGCNSSEFLYLSKIIGRDNSFHILLNIMRKNYSAIKTVCSEIGDHFPTIDALRKNKRLNQFSEICKQFAETKVL